jgi:2-polyprenyl-3-methyl-5-hydroxy-6-metoxy-1,4-benzoquinol methylase
MSDDNVVQTKNTYKKIYKEYEEANERFPDTVKTALDTFITYLKGKKVLDIGCAAGRESKYLDEKGLDVTGCDITEEFVESAKKNCPTCNFFVADMRSLNTHHERYDGLWVSASFLHIPKADALKTLQGFFNILNNNGILFLSVMKGAYDDVRPNEQMKWPARHFSDYESSEMQALLMKAGFTLLEETSSTTDWGPIFLIFYCTKHTEF